MPVVIIGLLLFGLAKAADLWIGFSSAGAAEIAEREAASEQAPAAAVPVADPGANDPILHQLSLRRAELDRREAALETREVLLEAAGAQLEARLAELAARETEIAAADAAGQAAKAAEIARLSDAYERMKPKDAARIFEALDADLLGPVAAGMRTQSLAGVLGEMEASKAKELTELLAQRRAATVEAP
jgi:flagellar motility protein MotE (MotC chaperone)